jgi:hypothetical protein
VLTLRVAEGPLRGRHAGLLIWPPRSPAERERTLGPLADADGPDDLERRLAAMTLRCRLETGPFGDLEVRRVLEAVDELPIPAASGPVPPTADAGILPARPPDAAAPTVRVLRDADEIREAAELLADAPRLALDIETACTRLPPERREERDAFEPWNGTVRLVQIAAPGPDGAPIAVIADCWEADPGPLLRLLGTPGREVVAHNARFEQSWLMYRWGVELAEVVDTCAWWSVIARHLAAAGVETGVEDARLVSLADRIVGLELDKSYQTSDWAAEDLSEGQLAYAGLDAAVLLPLADSLERIGGELGCVEQARLASRAGARRAAYAASLAAERSSDERDEALRMLDDAASTADLGAIGAAMRRMVLSRSSREALAAAFRARRADLAADQRA